jgi:site-specific DNA recombinase
MTTTPRVLGVVDLPRVLGAVRQSRTTDKALSPEVQTKAIRAYVADNQATEVKITVDLSTSGGTSAFKRDGLGPYLTDPAKIDTWDTLVITKLDRACRDLADYLKLSTWCDKHGKKLVVLDDPSMDTSTPQGRAMANMRATFAEYEREMGKVRNKERYEELKSQGRWTGGRVNYGYRYDAQAQHLVPDEGGTADVLRAMADLAIDGKSQWQIARWLNDSGHRTTTKRRQVNWTQDTVRRVLRHPMTHALLGEDKSAELWAALRMREVLRSGPRANERGLLGVAFCAQCGEPLYLNLADRPCGGYYRHLRNRSADIPCKVRVRKDTLEEQTEDSLLFLYGDLEYVEYQLVPGDDHQATIHELERDIATLEKITGTEAVVTMKRAEIEHLQTMGFDPDHWEPVPQGIKVRAYWATLDETGRTAFLRKRRVRVLADKRHFEFHGGLLAESEMAPGILAPAE